MLTAEGAFKELFTREYGNMCRYALSFMQDSHLAEDVVQETFVKFWEQKKELSHSTEAKFYLVIAVRNNCITALRKQNSSGVHFVENAPDHNTEVLTTERQLREDADERTAKIQEALDQLPPKCREVFLLVKMQGLSYKQAAEALDISVKTIENQMGKAIKILREHVRPVIILLIGLLLLKNLFNT